ncbi:MAG: Flp pilus assembly complex ATPase component TadA [Kiritimatiellae bacterium]|nr:Flp pilus assembly complex ATPase component TadA [Kiritimatiellia bacterium]
MAFSLDFIRPGEGTATRRTLQDGSYLVGRGAACHLQLPYPDVSERHALLLLRGDTARLEDLHSANGTYVNGAPIDGLVMLQSDSVVQIGESMLRVSPLPAEEPCAAPPPSSSHLPSTSAVPNAPSPAHSADPRPAPAARPDAAALKAAAIRRQVKEQIQQELIERLDLKRLTVSGVDRAGLEKKASEKIHEIVDQVRMNGKLPRGIDAARLEREIFNEALRLGPLEDLLADDTVTEIMVNGPRQIYVERHGKLQLADMEFVDDASVMAIIERIVSPIGRRIDESQPYVDARLADGSRVNAIIPPLSLSGPTLTIRKFAKRTLTTDDFIRFGTWTRNAAEFMKACVVMRKNVVVAGGTGSGKTTLLNLLSGFIPHDERIVTVEDAAELKLVQPHVVRLEARPPNIEGRGAVTIRDLVKNCLRMRPDRIIVGECRGGEALDMLQAMNTGHDGSLTTVHANSPRDVISRLETMVLMSGMELPSRAIREQIASAVDVIIHESRLSDGSRKVVAISEVTGLEGQNVVMQDIFAFRQSGVDEHGRVQGAFRPTGAVPTFFEHLKSRGLRLDPAMFDPSMDREVRLEVAGENS